MTKIAFMFPGVGSHYSGMGKSFYDNFKVFRETFQEASDTLGFDFSQLCFSQDHKDQLNLLEYSQTALLAVSIATYRILKLETGLEPDYCMGYSLGEYSALCSAGAISFPDALQMVWDRGKIISEAAFSLEGSMAWTVNLDTTVVEQICKEASEEGHEIYVSAYDCPDKASISGSNQAIQRVGERVVEAGGLTLPIKMSGPFHSPLMKTAAEKYYALLQNYEYGQLNYDVIANRNALPYTSDHTISENLFLQLIQPIRWQDSMMYLLGEGCGAFVEIGPKTVLKYLMLKNTDQVPVYSLEKVSELEILKEGLWITENDYLPIISRSLNSIITTKNYNPDHHTYGVKVVQPYQEMKKTYEALLAGELHPQFEQVQVALELVKQALAVKKVPKQVQQKKLMKVLDGKILPFKIG